MTRHRSLLGCVAIAIIIGLGLPSLTASASAGTAPPTTEPTPDDPTTGVLSAEPVATSNSVAPTPTETNPSEPPAEPVPLPVSAESSTPSSTYSDPELTHPAPIESATTGPTIEVADTLAPTPALADPTFGVDVLAVCIDLAPVVQVNSTGTGDVQVAVGPAAMILTAAQPTGQLPWPTVDGITLDSSAKWDAVRLDTMQPIANGVLTLPADCLAPPIVPSAPEGLTATPGNATVALHWSPPTSEGGSPIVDYIVERSPDGITAWTTVEDGAGTATSATITGLTNGTLYYFRVLAVNNHGTSPASLDIKVTPRAVPGAPQSLAATPTNLSGQVRLTWSVPASNGGSMITDYIIQRSLTGTSGWTLVADGTSTATAFTATGLTNGSRHYFRVYAVNAAGTGTSSVVVNAVPRSVPSAPRSLAAAPTNDSGRIRLSWVAPSSNGGSAITDYTIQRSPNGTTGWTTITDGVSTATAYTVGGLTNGARYYFRVHAKTASGTSPASNTASAVPRYVLSAPRSLVATPGNRSVRLSWTAPLSNGGSAITDYIIQRSPNGSTSWTAVTDGVSTATAYTVGGLTNGARYYFRVFARTARATSASSNLANTIPRTVPSAPRSVVAAPTNLSGQVRLTWVAPSSNGGSAITDYIIQRSSNGTTWTTLNDGVSTTTAYTATGLANGARYYFRIIARNIAGNSTSSTVVSGAPRTVPGRVGYFEVYAYYDGFDLYWGNPVSTGGSPITGFVVQEYDYDYGYWFTIGVADPSWRFAFVEEYGYGCGAFRIAALNAVGVGPFSGPVEACYW